MGGNYKTFLLNKYHVNKTLWTDKKYIIYTHLIGIKHKSWEMWMPQMMTSHHPAFDSYFFLWWDSKLHNLMVIDGRLHCLAWPRRDAARNAPFFFFFLNSHSYIRTSLLQHDFLVLPHCGSCSAGSHRKWASVDVYTCCWLGRQVQQGVTLCCETLRGSNIAQQKSLPQNICCFV